VEWFNALRPVETTVETSYTCGQGRGCFRTEDTWIRLANGTAVHVPEDLRPLLPPNSETERHIAARDRASRNTTLFGLTGAVALLGGFMYVSSATDLDTGTTNTTDQNIGYGLIAGGLIAAIAAWHYQSVTFAETRRAFGAYADDLATTFRICTTGLQVVACGDGAPGSAEP